jgi:protein-disulfide isomerase
VLIRVRTEADGETWQVTAFGGAVLVLAAAIPFVSNALIKTRVPDVVAEEMKKTPPGQVTIVDFVDFECPYCRQTATDLAPTLDKYRGKFRLVRKEMPLKRIHPHALAAARAECCAEDMGQGDRMADEMMSVKPEELTDDGCASMAARLGMNEAAFRACMSDPKTTQRLEADEADFRAVHGHSLPLIWINDQVVEGAQGPDALRQAMEKALAEVGS